MIILNDSHVVYNQTPSYDQCHTTNSERNSQASIYQQAQQLIQGGFVLTTMPLGSKGPVAKGWQLKEKCLTSINNLKNIENKNIGLVHEHSGTCCLDIDNHEEAARYLLERGIDLADLLASSPFAIVGKRGTKPLFRVPKGFTLKTQQIRGNDGTMIFELRATGGQDVLPPSRHPEGINYAWKDGVMPTSVSDLPSVPSKLLAFWLELQTPKEATKEHKTLNIDDSDRAFKYCLAALANETARVASTGVGGRNVALYQATHALAGFIHPLGARGAEYEQLITDEMTRAGLASGLAQHEVVSTLRGAIYGTGETQGGKDRPREIPAPYTYQQKNEHTNTPNTALLLPEGLTKLPSKLALIRERYSLHFCAYKPLAFIVQAVFPKAIIATTQGALAQLRKRYSVQVKGKSIKALGIDLWAFNESSELHKLALEHYGHIRIVANSKEQTIRTAKRVKGDLNKAFERELAEVAKLPSTPEVPVMRLGKPNTATLIRSPMGTGKTKNALGGIMADANAQGLRTLFVTPRQSLGRKLAKDFNLENYEDYSVFQLGLVNRSLVICFDSLWKLNFHNKLPDFDQLIIDESEQLAKHAVSDHIEHKDMSWNVLSHYRDQCSRVVALDASLGEITEKFVSKSSKEIVRHVNHTMNLKGVRVSMPYSKDEALESYLSQPEHTWLATDSLKQARDLEAYLLAANPNLSVLAINSETSKDEQQTRYFANPTHEAQNAQTIIATPAVQTGLSDESQQWPRVVGIFNGLQGTADDQFQAMRRARAATELEIWTSPRKCQVKSQDDIKASLEANATYGGVSYINNQDYLEFKAFVEGQVSKKRSNIKMDLAFQLASCGAVVDYGYPDDVSEETVEERETMKTNLKAAGLSRYIADRLAVARLDANQASELRKKKDSLTKTQRFSLEVFDLCELYGIQGCDDDTLANYLELDDYGRFGKKLRNYLEFSVSAEDAQKKAQVVGAVTPSGDARNAVLRNDFYRLLGEAIHLTEVEQEAQAYKLAHTSLVDEMTSIQQSMAGMSSHDKGKANKQLRALEVKLKKLSSASTHTIQVDALKAFVLKHHSALERELDFSSEADLDKRFVNWLGTALRSCGLKLVRGNDRSYSLDLTCVLQMSEKQRASRGFSDVSLYSSIDKKTYLIGDTAKIEVFTASTVSVEVLKNQSPPDVVEVSPPDLNEAQQLSLEETPFCDDLPSDESRWLATWEMLSPSDKRDFE